jgi:hypothetical protein
VGECKEMRFADIDTESAVSGGVWRVFERARVRFVPFLRMGSSDNAETGATQAVANQIGAAPCRCERKSHSLVLRGGGVQVPAPILFLEYVFYGWILIIRVLFSSFEGLGAGWQSTFSSVEYRLFE